jgi:hypothetical protein
MVAVGTVGMSGEFYQLLLVWLRRFLEVPTEAVIELRTGLEHLADDGVEFVLRCG